MNMADETVSLREAELMLKGSGAFCRMVAAIVELKRTRLLPGAELVDEEDSGVRHDYAGADRAIALALDSFADNTGFRMALANYLLTVQVDGLVPSLAHFAAESMLTDCGYRPVEGVRGGGETAVS
jgi:hypothetical protein